MKKIQSLLAALCLLICFTAFPNVTTANAVSADISETSSAEDNIEFEFDWYQFNAQFTFSDMSATSSSVQVFDVNKGKVVLTTKNTDQIQKTAKQWLSEIKQLAPEIQPDMNATYIVRIPLIPAQTLSVGNITLKVNEMYTFYYADSTKEPLILIFDENKKPYFFHINDNLTPFIESLNIPD